MTLRRCVLLLALCASIPAAARSRRIPRYLLPSMEAIRADRAAFATRDSFAISGAWYRPQAQSGRRPVVILVHAFGGDHTEWTPFVPDLIGQGYLVLACDLRGHGESTDRNGTYTSYGMFETEDLDRMPSTWRLR